jgi:uncharacterized protein (TIGR03118 family)
MRKIWIVAAALAGVCVSCAEDAAPDQAAGVEDEGGEIKLAPPPPRIAALVQQTNIVADREGQEAAIDPDLVNPWGLAFAGNGVAWTSLNASGLAGLYNSDGNPLLKVGVPRPARRNDRDKDRDDEPASVASAPTGVAFNADSATHQGDLFVFGTEDGTVVGWQPRFNATGVVRFDGSFKDAIYKGVALGSSHGQPRVYAADFHNARVDVFDDAYAPVRLRPGSFFDLAIPFGFAPFNVFFHDGLLFVSYAKQDRHAEDDVPGPGNGFVDVFDPDGALVDRLIARGPLNAPWGMAFTAASPHGPPAKLLVGNFGDGRINVFAIVDDGKHGMVALFEGALGDRPHHALVIDGLWAIVFGPDLAGFNAADLFFTAGPEGESHGLLGRLTFAQ